MIWRIASFLVGLLYRVDTSTMVEEFREVFPGKCLICSFQRWGYREGLTKEAEPKPHFCIEAERAKSPVVTLGGIDPRGEAQAGQGEALHNACTACGNSPDSSLGAFYGSGEVHP